MNIEFPRLRSLLPALACVGSAVTGFAQSTPVPITAPIRNGGTYHVETGTWTRSTSASTAQLGADVVYNNSCFNGYFFPIDDNTIVDEGRLPSVSSPTNAGSRPGCAAAYTIDGIEFVYCTDALSGPTYTLDFHQSYASCTSLIGVTPTASLTIPMLASPFFGTLTCWSVTIDLGANAFTLLADGDGVYQGAESDNLFGWSLKTNVVGAIFGPVYAGDPSSCSRYDGTRWDNGPTAPFWPNNLGEPGTGMGTLDQFWIEGGFTPPSCLVGGLGTLASFHMVLYSDACSTPTGLAFCAGDGSGTACPCGNNSVPGSQSGCVNTTGLGAKISVVGDSNLSNDTIVLIGSQMPVNSSCLFIQGNLAQSGGAGVVFGDGLRCVTGSVVRLGTDSANSGGLASYPSVNGQPSVSVRGLVTASGVRHYQAWYRNAPTFCTPSAFNLSNGWTLTWAP